MSPRPYWADDTCALYLGDCREILPGLSVTADLICTDPPYGETSLKWDQWVDGWLDHAAQASNSMWCFGSMRMFLGWRDQFIGRGWKLSQDIVWEKHNGSGFQNDRFKRVHEHALHWYLGEWGAVRHETPRITGGEERRRGSTKRVDQPPHAGAIGSAQSRYEYDGMRLARSVIYAASTHGHAIAPTQKPVSVLTPLIEYGCPPGGLVLDLFAGSASTLDAARQCGRRAIGIEADEVQIERAAHRLSQGVLDLGTKL